MRYMNPFSLLLATLSASFTLAATTDVCPTLSSTLTFDGVNATVISSIYILANTNMTIVGGQSVCKAYTIPQIDICRITISITTSPSSSTYMEVWLPSSSNASTLAWNGRFLSTGGGGLNGCVDYDNMVYTSSLGFAVTGDNGGHNGTSGNGIAFLNNNDVVLDFAYRARHAAVVVGKQVSKQYYGLPHKKAYYFGCSTGGRQGLKAAQMFPEDFDGIVAGSPASDFNHLTSWSAHFITLTGLNASDPRYLGLPQWTAVHAEVLRQCDPIDGVLDGILEDASICNFNPERILCSVSTNLTGCLTNTQAQTVRNVFKPVYGLNNGYIYPRLSPGAELSGFTLTGFGALAGGLIGPGPTYYQNVIYNNTSWDPTTFNALDIAYADSLDAYHGHISTYSGDLSAFRFHGGKLLTYHGGADPIIPGDQSMRYYRHIASTMNITHTDLDSFYRLFRISGMGHCSGGSGAWAFGQNAAARNASESILWDLVKWVEQDQAPERLVGTKWVNDSSVLGVQFQRAHCRYPYRTTYVGGNPNATASWDCQLIPDWDVCGGPSDRLPKLC